VSAQQAIWMMSSEAMQRRKEESFAIMVCVCGALVRWGSRVDAVRW
jgi:hypothetical protein